MIEQAIRLDFLASNNEAEYEAILAGINLTMFVSWEASLVPTELLTKIIQSDFQLVIWQVNREYET